MLAIGSCECLTGYVGCYETNGGFVLPEFTQGMILPTVNGESVDTVGQPALKTEVCKVSSDGVGHSQGVADGCLHVQHQPFCVLNSEPRVWSPFMCFLVFCQYLI